MTRIKYLRQAEVQQLFAMICSPRDRALFAAIYHYALRVTEATVLNLSDVDFSRQTILITRLKKGRGGEFPLLSNTAKNLKNYLPHRLPTSANALFTGRQGRLGTRRIQQLFRTYAQRGGLDSRFSVHSLRHSAATHLKDAGFDDSYVQSHLGHVRIESTKIYAQVTDKLRAKAFEFIEACPDIVKL